MKISPALVLFLLSAAIAELLSGSAPPIEFFNPIGFVLLSLLYGSGAVVVRELKIRWNKGYVSMFLLGAAYGVIEEALMVKSFFDPQWMELGVLGIYGRWQGVNWVWAQWLTIYHAIFSIAIPITLVELAYPKKRNVRWVSNRKFIGLVALLMGVTVFGYLFLTDFYPPYVQYFFFVFVVIFLSILAWKIPSNVGKGGSNQILTPRKIFAVGFLVALTFFLFFGAGPYIYNEPLILLIIGTGLVSFIFFFLRRYDWNEDTLYHKFALVAGSVVFLVSLTPFQELDKSRLDNTQGMLIVGIITLIMLFLLRQKLKPRAQRTANALKANASAQSA